MPPTLTWPSLRRTRLVVVKFARLPSHSPCSPLEVHSDNWYVAARKSSLWCCQPTFYTFIHPVTTNDNDSINTSTNTVQLALQQCWWHLPPSCWGHDNGHNDDWPRASGTTASTTVTTTTAMHSHWWNDLRLVLWWMATMTCAASLPCNHHLPLAWVWRTPPLHCHGTHACRWVLSPISPLRLYLTFWNDINHHNMTITMMMHTKYLVIIYLLFWHHAFHDI